MDWLVILLSQVLVIVRNELLYWSPKLSEVVINISVLLLPEDWRERYKYEFKDDMLTYNGSFCQLIRSIGFIWAALGISKELSSRFTGEYCYELRDSNQNTTLEGTCIISTNFYGRVSAKGIFQNVKNDSCHPNLLKFPILWKSRSVTLKLNDEDKIRIIVRYQIMPNGEIIPGEFEGEPDQYGNLRGIIDREPIKQGYILLRKNKRKLGIEHIIIAYIRVILDSISNKFRCVKQEQDQVLTGCL